MLWQASKSLFRLFSPEITTRLGFSEWRNVWGYSGMGVLQLSRPMGVWTSACEQTERGAADILSFCGHRVN